MKILVTGGAGFIGSHIVEHYQDKAEEIRVLDNLRTGYLKNLEGLRHTFIEGSICDRELVRQAVQGVDYIFHMAALVSVPESMSKIGECIDINVNGLLNVLEPYYKNGEYGYLLNSDKELDLLNKRFIVFELDVVKDNPVLFPVVTIIIMETFINKMRRLQGIRKMILIEEA